jgi:capsular polysaccharide export protein
MKILCLSTLDKFSRFYLDIEREIRAKKGSDISLKVFSLYFSGFLYAFLRDKFSSWISLKVWFLARRKKEEYSHIINETKIYKGVAYNSYLKFHLGLNKNISKQSLQLQALAYIDIFDSIFNKEQPDYLISIGDSRMCIEIAIALAKLKNVKVYYIEQGPFNTTFFDDIGVNANLSIRNSVEYNLTKTSDSDIELNLKRKSSKYNRSPIYRGMDMFFMKLFENSDLYPPDLKFTDLNSSKLKTPKQKNNIGNTKSNDNIMLLALQVPLDVNMIYHSPIFKSHTEILKSVYSSLPRNSKLVIREHPLFIDKYEKTFYEFVTKNDIIIDNVRSLNEAVEASDVVIVNNSTVGIEAILKYKPVVVLGDSFYDNSNICLKLKSKKELETLMGSALTYSPNKQLIDNFKHTLISTVLIKGSITDKNLIASKHIANHILAHH